MSDPQIKEGPHYFYRRIEFWAENGLITVVDMDKAADERNSVDDAIRRVRPTEFLKRCASVRVRFLHSTLNDQRESIRLMENAEKAVKLALSQGDPLDPAVQRYNTRHIKKNSLLMPAPQGNFKIKQPDDPRKAILNGVQVVPDFAIHPGQPMSTELLDGISQKVRQRRR